MIATRASRLARAQSQRVGEMLQSRHAKVSLRLLPLTSEADRIQDKPLAAFGGKGLFTREIEAALLARRADIAVHSLKDQPTAPTRGLVTVAVPRRASHHDVLIARDADRIEDLPRGARVGTSGPRRRAQILRLRPDLQVVPLRGNVETRIAKVLRDREVDATLLAAAGLERLGLSEHLSKPIPVDQVLPAAGQGALAVQCRADDHVSVRRCTMLNDALTSMLVSAERSVVAALDADCHSPLAVLAEAREEAGVHIAARVLTVDGSECLEAVREGALQDVDTFAGEIAAELIERGAPAFLRAAARGV